MGQKLRKLKGFEEMEVVDDIQTIEASRDPEMKDWIQDPTHWYFLVKIDREKKKIDVGFAHMNDHKVKFKVVGNEPKEIYYTILRDGRFISTLHHAANLGMELEKAYIALQHGYEYNQDADIYKKPSN